MDKEELKNMLLQYGFYDEEHKYNIVLNQSFLKELFKCDNILLEETEHK